MLPQYTMNFCLGPRAESGHRFPEQSLIRIHLLAAENVTIESPGFASSQAIVCLRELFGGAGMFVWNAVAAQLLTNLGSKPFSGAISVPK